MKTEVCSKLSLVRRVQAGRTGGDSPSPCPELVQRFKIHLGNADHRAASTRSKRGNDDPGPAGPFGSPRSIQRDRVFAQDTALEGAAEE